MTNGQQIGEQNLVAFITWSATQSDEDFKQIIHRGQLNRAEIAKAVGCGKSALTQNSKVRKQLKKLENELRERKVLPQLTDKAVEKIDKPKEYDNTTNRRILNSNRLSILEQENIELKAKVKELESALENFGELSETLAEMGMMPR